MALLTVAATLVLSAGGAGAQQSPSGSVQRPAPQVLISSSKLRWVRVPAGSFKMGSPAGERGREAEDEGPVHTVHISRGFLMKQTEVTQAEFQRIAGVNPSRLKGCGKDCPVEHVTWFEALHFCNLLSRKEGFEPCYVLQGCRGTLGQGIECDSVSWPRGLDCRGYRLPTEAEWERAARAGTATATYNGDITTKHCLHRDSAVAPIAWYCHNAKVEYEDCHRPVSNLCWGTHPVGQKGANPWGLHDMLGSVAEWCWDWYNEKYYGRSPGRDPLGPQRGHWRVARGGGFGHSPPRVRAARRFWFWAGRRMHDVGFRPVRSK